MTDLVGLNAPFMPYFSRPSRSACVTRGGTIYYPISLLSAASYAIGKGFDAKVIDLIAEPRNNWMESIVDMNPKIILVDTSTPSIYNDINVADTLQAKLPKSKVVLCGRHVTYAPSESLKMCKEVNTVLRGELFIPTVEMLEGKDPKSIKGTSHIDKGKVVHNKNSELLQNLDEIGMVAKIIKDQLDTRKYFYASLMNPYIMLQTAWGCPYDCNFCSEVTKRKWRHRSIESVIEELKFLDKEMPHIKEIYWDDPTFVVDENFTQQLCNSIIENKIKVRWSCVTRANITYDTLKIMKQANGRTMHIGLESTNQESLNNVNKNMELQEELDYLERCKKAGVMNHVCLIFGLPGDTNETLRSTVGMMKKLPAVDSVQIFPLIPTPFEDILDKESESTMWDYLIKNNYLLTRDYSKWLKPNGTYNCVISYPNLSNEDIEKWVETGYKEFYFRAPYALHKLSQSLRNFEELKRNTRGFITMLKR